MARFARSVVAISTFLLVGVSVLGLAPWLGRPVPVASAQFQFGGQFGGGGCGFQFGGFQFGNGCGFGGFGGGLQFGGGQTGGFNFGNGCAGFNFGGGFNLGGFQFSGQCGGLQFGGQFGGQFGVFALVTPTATVGVGQRLPISFLWEVPAPASWHTLRSLELRIREGTSTPALWIRWDESSNTFVQIDPSTEQPLASARPGSSGTFESALFTLNLAESAVADTGNTGTVVALLLPITAKSGADGREFTVEERGISDAGEVQGFRAVSTLSVAAANQRETDDAVRRSGTAQQRQRTDRSGRDDVYTEGDVLASDCDADTPTVTIANRDGKVVVSMLKDAAEVCRAAQPGTYLQVDGEKVNEALFEAYQASVSHR